MPSHRRSKQRKAIKTEATRLRAAWIGIEASDRPALLPDLISLKIHFIQRTQLKVNLEFYRDGKLIDVKNETLHEIKVLDAGESIAAKKDRNTPNSLSDEEKAAFAFDEVRASVTSFSLSD